MVENKTVGKQLPLNLKNKFREASNLNYFEAFTSIEEYIYDNKIELPERIRLPNLANSQNIAGTFNHQTYNSQFFHLNANN